MQKNIIGRVREGGKEKSLAQRETKGKSAEMTFFSLIVDVLTVEFRLTAELAMMHKCAKMLV